MSKADRQFNPTEKPQHFIGDNGDKIILDVEDSRTQFAWRLTVNGDIGPIYSLYSGIYIHKGWGIVSAYYGEPKEFVPFRIVYATEKGK